jgi:hypothetical protein
LFQGLTSVRRRSGADGARSHVQPFAAFGIGKDTLVVMLSQDGGSYSPASIGSARPDSFGSCPLLSADRESA